MSTIMFAVPINPAFCVIIEAPQRLVVVYALRISLFRKKKNKKTSRV